MPSTDDNYVIEIPRVVQLQFRNRKTTAVVIGATTFTAMLGLTCWVQLLGVVISTAHQPGCGTTNYLVLGPNKHAPESKAVYIYLANDPSVDDYGVHLWARPGLNRTSHVYYDTENGRLDVRISMGSAVTALIRHWGLEFDQA